MVLRIEDLDSGRSRQSFSDEIMRDYEFLGLHWDSGPFYQSSRFDEYQDAFNELKGRGLVYPCFCTRADLHAASAPHAGEKPVYPGSCRNLDDATRSSRERDARAHGREPSQRLIVPHEVFGFDDIFQGHHEQLLDRDCGDFVIRRSDGSFAYQLAVVLDDALQGVNCVVRGCDLLSSTPQQMYLQQLFGLPEPLYAHVPLMMGPDGNRLSKRHEDASLEHLLERYKSPAAIMGHIAYVSGLIGRDEPCMPDDLIRNANLDALSSRSEIAWC